MLPFAFLSDDYREKVFLRIKINVINISELNGMRLTSNTYSLRTSISFEDNCYIALLH